MTSDFNEQLEMLKALLELRAIKRDGMDVFFKLEDALSKIGELKRTLADESKKDSCYINEKMAEIFSELFNTTYELQRVLTIGEI